MEGWTARQRSLFENRLPIAELTEPQRQKALLLLGSHRRSCPIVLTRPRWEEFARNQEIISDNANGKSYLGRGSVRHGEALLPGLFRCGRYGRKLTVHYGSRGTHTQRYACRGAFSARAEMSCISFGGMRVDRVVAQEVLERVQPLGVEAALTAMKNLELEHSEKRLQLENALEQARFEAARAYRQYDASDPENRLVTAELERRWNERLVAVRGLEEEIARVHN